MQIMEKRKTITVSPELHQRIVKLRRGNQTFGDVVEAAVAALEEENGAANVPRFEDLNLDEHVKEAEEAEKNFEENYVSLENVLREYERKHGKV